MIETDESIGYARKVRVDLYFNYLVIYIYGGRDDVLQVLDLPTDHIFSVDALIYEDVNDDGYSDIKINVKYSTGIGEFGARDYPAEVICINRGNGTFEDPIFNPTN